jgi:hypothetical protein
MFTAMPVININCSSVARKKGGNQAIGIEMDLL